MNEPIYRELIDIEGKRTKPVNAMDEKRFSRDSGVSK